jgi:pantetheine-phosphate adenylyltransferase
MHRLAIYPGTFDPITNGHLDILDRASDLFDEVVIAVAKNSQKSPLFSETERLSLIRDAIAERLPTRTNIRADAFQGLLVEHAEQQNAVAIIRGIRVMSDFEYEFQLALMNRKLRDKISTVFLLPHERYTYLNSTIVRELARYDQDVSEFVPACVARALKDKFIQKSL